MTSLSRETVKKVLSTIIDPHTSMDLVDGGSIADSDIEISDMAVSVGVTLGYPAQGWHEQLREQVTEAILAQAGVESVEVSINTKVVAHEVQKGVTPIKGVRNMIAVASGKGGVGKSTLSVNLALALSAEGANVGLLDADIYGPSQPRMLGINGRPESKDGKSLEPLNSYHLQAMSIGFLIEEDTPMIWRGP
ncbi:MAG: P-loop NTPase, partial [Gammaproteobacteria bacterium]|nr:P-loop NTPase [Gammaproteobacteria bacterium]